MRHYSGYKWTETNRRLFVAVGTEMSSRRCPGTDADASGVVWSLKGVAAMEVEANEQWELQREGHFRSRLSLFESVNIVMCSILC